MSEKAAILAGCAGMAAAVVTHAAAWRGAVGGFWTGLALVVGSVLVWIWADRLARSKAGGGVSPSRGPAWLARSTRVVDVAIMVYAAAYFLSIVYVRFVRHSCPTPALRAQLYSVVAFALYFQGTVLAWVSRGERRSEATS